MRVTEMWKSGAKPTVSFELYPAKTDKAAANLEKTIDTLAAARPDFVAVTFGAGGTTRTGSLELLDKLHNRKGLEVIGYFACYGLGPDDITAVLDSYRDLGVENLLAVRGDIPRDQEDFTAHPDSLAHASDLLAFIRPRWDFCLGAAGYPEGHVEAGSTAQDLEYLKLKVDCGAEYVLTNYFYDNRYFFTFLERCHRTGIAVPIVPGVMPIFNVKMMNSLAALCGATIPDELRRRIAALPEADAEALVNLGIEVGYAQCRELLAAGVPGVHIYTMDRSRSAVEIVNRLRADGLV